MGARVGVMGDMWMLFSLDVVQKAEERKGGKEKGCGMFDEGLCHVRSGKGIQVYDA